MVFTGKLATSDSNMVGSTMIAGGSLNDPLVPVIEHVLGITDFTGPEGLVDHTIAFSDQASITIIVGLYHFIEQDLGLSDPVGFTGTLNFVDQDLGIGQSVDFLAFSPVGQTMLLNQVVTFTGPILVSVSDTIGMGHAVGLSQEITVSQSLGITQLAADVQKQDLGLIQEVMGYLNATPIFEQNLGMSHSAVPNAIYTIQLTHTNIVTQSLTYFIDDGTGCPRNDFQQYGTLGPEPQTVASGAVLSFQNITGTDDLVILRNPELDDRDRVGYTRINRESQGGELQVYRDPTWPLVNTIQGTIVGLKNTDVDDWLSFMSDHLGEEVSMSDWHGRYWRGVVINPGEPVVEDTRNRWTVAFEFEGTEMDGPDTIQQVGLSHVAGFVVTP